MAGLKTGTQELLTCGQDIANTNHEITGILTQLASVIDGVEGAWKGQAKDAFKVLTDRFTDDAKTLNKALDDIATQVTGSVNLYIQQQEEQSTAMNNVLSRLGK